MTSKNSNKPTLLPSVLLLTSIWFAGATVGAEAAPAAQAAAAAPLILSG